MPVPEPLKFQRVRDKLYAVLSLDLDEVEFVASEINPRDGAASEWWDIAQQLRDRQAEWEASEAEKPGIDIRIDEGGMPHLRVSLPPGGGI